MKLLKLCSLVVMSGVFSLAMAANKDKLAPAVLEVDTAATTLKWLGKKVTGEHHGQVPVKSGTVKLAGDNLVGGEFEIDLSKLTDEDLTDPKTNEKLVGHLKSEDFFNVEKFPTAKFVIKSVKPLKGKGEATHTVSGDLTIKDQTKALSFPATVTSKEGVVTAKASIEVDRTQWGLKYGSGKFFKGLGDKVINDKFVMDLNLQTKK